MAQGTDYSTFDERDIDELKNNPFSKIIVFDKDDFISQRLIYIFKACNRYEYTLDYDHLKDLLKWNNLKAKEHSQTVIDMYRSYVSNKQKNK